MELHIRDGLTAAQGVALQVEAHSIQNLLRDGHRSIQDIRHIAASADSVFVLASIGVERAMKLLLGLGSLRDEGRWPPPLRILGWGETLVELDASLEDALAVSALVARHRDYSALLLDDHRSDRLWHPLVDVLDCYGPAHQFSVVDRLAEVDDYWEAPLDSWNRFEFAILSHRPTLAEILTSPLEGLTGRREISDEAARALLRWWNLIHQLCAEGCFGERGTTLSAQLAPPGPESELTGAPVVSPFAS